MNEWSSIKEYVMVDTLYASLEGIVLLIMRKRVGVPRGVFSAKRATLSSVSIRGRVRNSAQATYYRGRRVSGNNGLPI